VTTPGAVFDARRTARATILDSRRVLADPVVVADLHADAVELTEAGTSTSTPASPTRAPATLDNGAQAGRAAERRGFTPGGDAEPRPPTGAAAAPAPGLTPAPAGMLDAALARLRAPTRPSPFALPFFPTLPAPPERADAASVTESEHE
jgi:hypothetical protein